VIELVDSHCHLDAGAFREDRDAVVSRARQAGVRWMVSIGSGDGPPDLEAGIRMAEAYDFVFASAGVHPHDASKAVESTWIDLTALAAHPKVVGIGEIGLDYHYNFSPPETQRAVFQRQLEIAAESALPVFIHTREAWRDTVETIRDVYGGAEAGGVFHCFSGGPAEAEEALNLGFHLSFSGIVTFPKADAIREALVLAPAERLLIETDAPYLAPAPHRGKRNEPAYLLGTATRAAEVRAMELADLARITTDNWRRLCLREKAANS